MRGWFRDAATPTRPAASDIRSSSFVRDLSGPLLALILLPLVTACGGPDPLTTAESMIRAEAESWLGTPYKWGGTTKAGVDCSAFTENIFASAFSIDLPRTAARQERLGLKVPKDSLQAGDLVFFRTGGFLFLFRRRHVGIYLRDGEFVHASGSKGVTVSRLDEPFWRREYKTARRVLAWEDRKWTLALPPDKTASVRKGRSG